MLCLQTIPNVDLEELKELGSGTYGTVYHGKWRGSDVAIKRIKASVFAGSPPEQERLVRPPSSRVRAVMQSCIHLSYTYEFVSNCHEDNSLAQPLAMLFALLLPWSLLQLNCSL